MLGGPCIVCNEFSEWDVHSPAQTCCGASVKATNLLPSLQGLHSGALAQMAGATCATPAASAGLAAMSPDCQ